MDVKQHASSKTRREKRKEGRKLKKMRRDCFHRHKPVSLLNQMTAFIIRCLFSSLQMSIFVIIQVLEVVLKWTLHKTPNSCNAKSMSVQCHLQGLNLRTMYLPVTVLWWPVFAF